MLHECVWMKELEWTWDVRMNSDLQFTFLTIRVVRKRDFLKSEFDTISWIAQFRCNQPLFLVACRALRAPSYPAGFALCPTVDPYAPLVLVSMREFLVFLYSHVCKYIVANCRIYLLSMYVFIICCSPLFGAQVLKFSFFLFCLTVSFFSLVEEYFLNFHPSCL